ncbi:MAG: ATP-binding cassette, subfamily bacterial CydC, partial [Subtercola sp.]|nr:ATP-binding cassette, subfamily bacterial CydC [Subtercola sp.]
PAAVGTPSTIATATAPQLPPSRHVGAGVPGRARTVPTIRLDHVSARWPSLHLPAAPSAFERTQSAVITSATPQFASSRCSHSGLSQSVWATAPALRDVTVNIRPGERLLVTGPSGSGKSTLAAVLVRFLEHTGTFTLDGVDVRALAPEVVRQSIGLCEQTPYIFDANIRQNLLFARETASDDDLRAVLDRVGLADWAADRGGLDAALGQHGALVSGGEAQRIALARVLLADFPVVIFDEPTANVDPARADALLRDLLAAAGPGRSVVLISHTDVPPELITERLRLG